MDRIHVLCAGYRHGQPGRAARDGDLRGVEQCSSGVFLHPTCARDSQTGIQSVHDTHPPSSLLRVLSLTLICWLVWMLPRKLCRTYPAHAPVNKEDPLYVKILRSKCMYVCVCACAHTHVFAAGSLMAKDLEDGVCSPAELSELLPLLFSCAWEKGIDHRLVELVRVLERRFSLFCS